MSDSILTSTKKALGLAEDYTAFDSEITMHINSVLATLNQLGVGPAEGFAIEDAGATWAQLIDADPRLNSVKSYIYVSVRLLFDPPQTGYVVTAMEKLKSEFEWRINFQREDIAYPYVEPVPTDPTDPFDSVTP